MTKILCVARVSTQQQKESGLGIAFQITEMARFIEENFGNQVEVKTFIDAGISGGASLSKREGLMSALSEMKKGDVLLSYDFSRIARDTMLMVMVQNEVNKKGGRIMTVNGDNSDTPEARFMKNIMMAVAEFSKDSQNAKIRLALKEKAKTHKLGKHAPYGYAFNSDRTDYVEIREEQDVIVMARGFARTLGKKWGLFTKLSRHLNNQGVRSRSGGEWSPQSTRVVFHKLLA